MGYTVLIVDDEITIATLLQDYFQEQGFRPHVCHDLAGAKKRLSEATLPDILILDVMLPDGNGVDFLDQLRAAPRTKALPIIIISAHRTTVRDRIEGFETGADDYLIKPFDLGELKSRVERLIARVQRMRNEL